MRTDANGRRQMRRQDRAMPDRADQLDVIRGGRHLTMAMSGKQNRPEEPAAGEGRPAVKG